MVMATGPVHVTMRQFLRARVAHIGYLDGEVQRLPRQRMVAVDRDLVAVDAGYRHRHRALWRLCLELHAHLQIVNTLEGVTRNHLDHTRIGQTVALFRRDDDIESVAGLVTEHLLLKPWNDVAGALQVAQGFTLRGRIDDLALGIGQGVMEACNSSFGNLHVGSSGLHGMRNYKQPLPRHTVPGLNATMAQSRRAPCPPAMSAAFIRETILEVRHWTEDYFSFTTSRDDGFRFENGQFVMLGLEVEGKPLLRAYSVASANWEEQLEFFSIKVANGPLTSRLQHIREGDTILLSRKPTGTLLVSDLLPGKTLYLLSTGTGLAPFLAIIKDPETYERFERVVLTHGVRNARDLAYADYIRRELPQNEFLGTQISRQLLYYPAVSREQFEHQGRLTTLLDSGRLCEDLGLPPLAPENDRFMICGGPAMLADFRRILDARGFRPAPRIGSAGHYVFERAFVDK